MEQYWALRVWGTREVRISEELRKRDLVVYCPMRTERVRWKDRVKVVKRPLLPTYIFLLGDVSDIALARLVSGVFSVMPSNNSPRPVDQEQINVVRLLEASGAQLAPVSYVPGQLVEVAHGPFKGISGTVRRSKGKTHFVVQVNIGTDSRAVDVEINSEDLI